MKNSKNKIKKGIISEQELVQLFGTQKQIDSYNKHGHFVSRNKYLVLDNAKRFCRIRECKNGNRWYNITSILEYTKPKKFSKMNSSIYKYLIPNILYYLVDDENNYFSFTSNTWANKIGLVNKNYDLLRNNIYAGSVMLDCEKVEIYRFFKRVNSLISYYFDKSFEYLDECGALHFTKTPVVKKEYIEEVYLSGNNKIKTKISSEITEATKEELELFNQCMSIADEYIDMKNKKERLYSNKSKEWGKKLSTELHKHGIKYFFYRNTLENIDIDYCYYLLKLYKHPEITNIKKELSNELCKFVTDDISNKNSNDSMNIYNNLIDITLNPKTEFIFDRVNSINKKYNTKNLKYALEVSNDNES